MKNRKRARLAYSTEIGPLCRHCGEPLSGCRCKQPANEPLPDKIVAKLRIEKSGRKGKTVTVVDGLPRNDAFLKKLARELKSACGSGGSASDEHVEIQGDHRDRLREVLTKKGWQVMG